VYHFFYILKNVFPYKKKFKIPINKNIPVYKQTKTKFGVKMDINELPDDTEYIWTSDYSDDKKTPIKTKKQKPMKKGYKGKAHGGIFTNYDGKPVVTYHYSSNPFDG
jgi:hypothetical protein